MRKGITGLVLILLFCGTGIIFGAIPQMLDYQGRLTDANSIPLTGAYTFVFGIFGQESGGAALWSETQSNISITNGVFNVKIGSITSIGPGIFESSNRWLEITVGGQTLAPRIRLVSNPYSFVSEKTYGVIGTTITSSNIVDATITSADVSAGTFISSGTPDTVDTYHIKDETILNTDINASAAIADTKLAQLTTTNKVATSAIASGILGSNVICSSIAINSVGIEQLNTNSVDTRYITNSSVTATYVHLAGDTMSNTLSIEGNTLAQPLKIINTTVSTAQTVEMLLRQPNMDSGNCNASFRLTDMTAGNAFRVCIVANGSEYWYMESDGTVKGTFGTYHQASDVRLKKDIVTIPNALEKVSGLRGVNFKWKNEHLDDDKLQMGLIAQEVESVVPEAVHTSDNEMKTKSVQYDNLIGLLVEGMKEQQKEIDELKQQISELKQK